MYIVCSPYSVSSVDWMERKRSELQLSGGYYWFVQPGPDLVQGHCPALPLNWGLMMTAGAGDRRHWPPLWWWLLTCMCLSEIDLRRNIPEVLRNWRTGFESSAPQRVFVILVSWSWLSQPSAGHSTPPPHHSPACRDPLLTQEVDISSEKYIALLFFGHIGFAVFIIFCVNIKTSVPSL